MLKPVIKDILQQTGILFCYIDESQKHHVRFARWLGFTPNLKLEGTNYTTYGRTT